MYTVNDASVAQWIERCPPEACAQVRLLSDAFFYCLSEYFSGILLFHIHLFLNSYCMIKTCADTIFLS